MAFLSITISTNLCCDVEYTQINDPFLVYFTQWFGNIYVPTYGSVLTIANNSNVCNGVATNNLIYGLFLI